MTGVSGAGKSTLVNSILYPAAARLLNQAKGTVGAHKSIKGLDAFDKVVNIDQSLLEEREVTCDLYKALG